MTHVLSGEHLRVSKVGKRNTCIMHNGIVFFILHNLINLFSPGHRMPSECGMHLISLNIL